MQRRDVLAALAAVGWSALSARPGLASRGGRGCFDLGRGGFRCTVGFVTTPPMAEQPCRSQCWATCLAYLLQGYGAEVETADVLHRIGASGCAPHDPATERARLNGVAGSWQDRAGRQFLLSLTPLGSLHETMPIDPAFPALLDRLSRQPVLCGAAGHATVVTEITTTTSANFPFRREAVTVRDPYTPTHGVRPLTEAELATPSWVLGVTVRPLQGA